MRSLPLTGARPSPNIWLQPGVYEIENHAFDRADVLAQTMSTVASWSGRDVLDVGCGTGFHLPWFADTARSVIGVEPHPGLAAMARRRVRRRSNVSVFDGLAESLPIASASVDVMHARWAYFFGPGCERGLAELNRVVRRGGTAYVVDNDPERSTFGGWFRRGYPSVSAREVEWFWTSSGWDRHRLDLAWNFDSRADFESVVRVELPTAVAEEVIAEHFGTRVDYAVNLWVKSF